MISWHGRLGAELLGVRLAINGRTVVEQPLMIHGNDGSAQVHSPPFSKQPTSDLSLTQPPHVNAALAAAPPAVHLPRSPFPDLLHAVLQYHVSIPGLPSGVFELRASLSLDAASASTVDDAVTI